MAGAPDWDLLVCRGCCCGSADKHRRTDHEGQLEELRAAAGDGAVRVLVSDCLDQCDRSNVVVLRPSRSARKGGARPLWLGGVLAAQQTAALADWLRRGGPVAGAVPKAVQSLKFRPGR